MAKWKIPKNDYHAGSQVTPDIFNTLAENERYLQEVKIIIDQVQDAFVNSTEAQARDNIAAIESIKDGFGKVRKWFSDLRTLAFKSTVATANIDALAVTSAKIASSAVTVSKIAANAVETSKIKDLAVTTVKIANGAVTDVKIDSVSASKVTGLHKVATSGSYNDLADKPSVPDSVSVVDNLSSTSRTAALSAYQGKVLNDKIADLGFRTGSISGVSNATLIRQGKLVIGYVTASNKTSKLFTLPEGFRPKTEVSGVYGTQSYNSGTRVYVDVRTTVTFKTNGDVTSSKNGNLSQNLCLDSRRHRRRKCQDE
ncbi:hypothetical protein [Anaerocaecibacter muris]|uniref:hypothetical protein n=1 Tax=Anaerocaecibacter muris TaxID=2941513 RepID=UPI00203ECCB8|nr:hypothetical protein [Anaerocaecibacter muris]